MRTSDAAAPIVDDASNVEQRVTRVRNNTNHHADPAHRNFHGLRCCPSERDAKDIDGRFSESATIHSLVFSRLKTTVRVRVCVSTSVCPGVCARLERSRRARHAPAQPATRPSRPRPAPSPVATPAPARDGQARVHPRIGRSSSVASGRLITPVKKRAPPPRRLAPQLRRWRTPPSGNLLLRPRSYPAPQAHPRPPPPPPGLQTRSPPEEADPPQSPPLPRRRRRSQFRSMRRPRRSRRRARAV